MNFERLFPTNIAMSGNVTKCLISFTHSALLTPKILHTALLIQLFKVCKCLVVCETDSEAYNKNGRQYAFSNCTVTISELAALERE